MALAELFAELSWETVRSSEPLSLPGSAVRAAYPRLSSHISQMYIQLTLD